MPQIIRLQVLFHEARHTEYENGNWSHATCPIPFLDENGNDVRGYYSKMKLEGLDACDETEYGSYGSATILLKNISLKCTNCSEKTRLDAGIIADDNLNRMIDAGARERMVEDIFL